MKITYSKEYFIRVFTFLSVATSNCCSKGILRRPGAHFHELGTVNFMNPAKFQTFLNDKNETSINKYETYQLYHIITIPRWSEKLELGFQFQPENSYLAILTKQYIYSTINSLEKCIYLREDTYVCPEDVTYKEDRDTCEMSLFRVVNPKYTIEVCPRIVYTNSSLASQKNNVLYVPVPTKVIIYCNNTYSMHTLQGSYVLSNKLGCHAEVNGIQLKDKIPNFSLYNSLNLNRENTFSNDEDLQMINEYKSKATIYIDQQVNKRVSLINLRTHLLNQTEEDQSMIYYLAAIIVIFFCIWLIYKYLCCKKKFAFFNVVNRMKRITKCDRIDNDDGNEFECIGLNKIPLPDIPFNYPAPGNE